MIDTIHIRCRQGVLVAFPVLNGRPAGEPVVISACPHCAAAADERLRGIPFSKWAQLVVLPMARWQEEGSKYEDPCTSQQVVSALPE